MKYFHSVTSPELPSLGNKHKHWAIVSKERAAWHERIRWLFTFKPDKPLELCGLRLIRYSNRMPDYDNLVYSFKPVIDGLVLSGILKTDRMDCIVQRNYFWVKVPQKESRIDILVSELTFEEIDPASPEYFFVLQSKNRSLK